MSYVVLERRGPVLIIKLNRPERRNAFDLEMRAAIADAIYQARDDDSVRSVVITGAGNTFCAGGDLKSLSEAKRPVFKDRERIRRLHIWFRELVNLEKPVIAAVDGAAFGAGFNLALACDFVIGTPRSRFCAAFGRIGLVPDLGGFFLLPRIVGLQRAKDIVFSAREIGAEEAVNLGILSRIVPQEQLLEEAVAQAERYSETSIEALGIAKNILNRSFNLDQDTLAELEASAQALALHTEYHDDAVDRFLTKQPLKFRGE
ncbi:enoyl-CoA hydratase/isomerase family protein [Vreelandella titanicae]|uniref:Short-chain-enoyl-CoA hydratase n=1 Tax=Vreelandella titanicae TaxID=664683 RepID=A0AAP9T2V9_9GAMM|nr:enoyl-CoA hydratase/isomerase family protein [Halomonas titanicae]QKS26765.1 Short-chain-enoyl-CoA hydratase [Halomonas titanicae]